MTSNGGWIRMTCAALTLTITVANASAQIAKSFGVADANTISESDLAALPHMTPAIAKAMVAKRPFNSITEMHAFLLGQGLTKEQTTELYPKAFVHINLNTATADEILLVPGAGRKMTIEFPEYRPWKTWAQFDRQIGKYIGGAENAQKLAQYTFIPMNANTASDADLLTVPGATQAWVEKLKQGRPYKTPGDLEKVLGRPNARFFVVE
jgi:DNA uptake protein ComE-like DNA-binding protein